VSRELSFFNMSMKIGNVRTLSQLTAQSSPLETQNSASSACQFLNPHCPLLNNSPSNNQKAASLFGHSKRNRYFCSEQTVKKNNL
jgi:hypothetical protein